MAAINGNYEVVNLLLQNGANMKIEDNEGKTARDHAIDALAELNKDKKQA